MPRIKSDIKRLMIISILLSLFLVLFSLRTTFFTSGTPEFGDFVFHLDMKWIKSRFLTTWNPYFSSDNGADVALASWFFWMLFVNSSEVAVKLLLFLTLFILSEVAFLVSYAFTSKLVKRQTNRYVAGAIGSVLAVMNPVTVIHLSHYTYIWWTAGLFLVLYFTDKIINAQDKKNCLKYTLVGAIPFMFCAVAFTFYSVVLTTIFVVCLIIFELIFSKLSFKRRLFNTLIFVLVMPVLVFLLAAYWIVPSLFGGLYSVYASGPQWMPKRTVDLLEYLWRNNDVLNTFTMTSPWNVGREFFTEGGSLIATWAFAILILPILSVLAIILARRERIVRILAGIVAVTVVLGSLPHNPLRNQYIWALGNLGLISWPLDFPDYFLAFLVVAHTVLGGLFVGLLLDWIPRAPSVRPFLDRKPIGISFGLSLHKMPSDGQRRRYSRKIISWWLVSMIVAISFIRAYPMVTGNLGGYFQPVNLPSSYAHMRDWLSAQQGTFRVLVFPALPYVDWIPHSLVSDFRRWIPPVPVFIPTGQTYDTPLQNLIFYFLWSERASLQNLGKLLNMANIRFVVYGGDMQFARENNQTLKNLYLQKDLSLVFEDGPIKIFENSQWDSNNAVYAVHKAMIVVGGLDALVPMLDIENFKPNRFATIFLDQKPYSIEELNPITSLDTIVLFYGDKNIDDFALGTVGRQYYLSPYDYLPKAKGLWHGTAANVPWIGLYGIVDGAIPHSYAGRGEFDLGKGFIWTQEIGAAFSFNINIAKDDEYELWVRAFRSPSGGDISLNISGHESVLDMYGNPGFVWIKATTLSLDKGSHSFSITNDGGLNIVNLVALVPSNTMANHMKDVQSFLGKENIRTLVLGTSQYFRWQITDVQYLKIDDIIQNWTKEAATIWEGRLITNKEGYEIPGKWEKVNGTLHSFGDAPYRFISENETVTDTIVARATVLASDAAPFIGFRAKDMSNLYVFGLIPWADCISLSKFINGSETVLDRYYPQAPVQKGQWYSLRVEAEGNHIKGYIDDRLVIDIFDDTFEEGRVGLWVYNADAYFKDISSQQNTAIKVGVPTSSKYIIALSTSGARAPIQRISVANQTLVGRQENGWEYFDNITLNGNTIIKFPRPIERLAVYTSKHNNERVDDILAASKSLVVIKGDTSNPSGFKVNIDAARPSMIMFLEKYYVLWQANSGNKTLTQYLVLSAYNGFLVPEPGSFEITIKFNPETWYHFGIVITFLTLIVVGCSSVALHRVSKREEDEYPSG